MEKIINHPPADKRWKRILKLIFVGLLVLSTVQALYFIFAAKSCYTAECFAEAANDCRKAKLEIVDDADMFWRYRAAAFCGGLEKTLVLSNDKETAPMKELLEGKSLFCDYTRGNFDKRWLTSLIFGLENCRGELKETLGQLLFLTQ